MAGKARRNQTDMRSTQEQQYWMDKPVFIFFALCIFRIFNSLFIETQFDPDEYWQNLEPAYCQAFQSSSSCAHTWEWTRRAGAFDHDFIQKSLHGPVRTYLSVLPTYLLYVALKFFSLDGPWSVARGPLIVHAVLVAAPTDFCVWWIARTSSSGGMRIANWSLFFSLTSWFQGYALVRTYSNSMETVLLWTGVALVGPGLFGEEKKKTTNTIAVWVAFFLGGMSVAVRFTSLASWIPLAIMLSRSSSYPSFVSRVGFLLVPCGFCGILGLGVSVLVDRFFYGFWTLPILGNIHFNVIQGLGSLYGTHPFHWYLTTGIPAVAGLLLPFLLFVPKRGAVWWWWVFVLPYVTVHSVSSHKEFRFLLPILPAFCLMAGQSRLLDRMMMTTKPLFVALNVLVLLFLARFHQGAPIRVNQYIMANLPPKKVVVVHYLMGCHSTPAFSHLHRRGVSFDLWHLDCSPACRRSSSLACESQQFLQDPANFIRQTYLFENDDECGWESSTTCVAKNAPDYLAIFSSDTAKIGPQELWVSLGMVETHRFPHSISDVKILPLRRERTHSNNRRTLLMGMVELVMEEMILYSRRERS